MDLSISIVNHNSTQSLLNCLRSLERNLDGLQTEIYVVDNLCEDRAKEAVEREFPAVKVLSQDQVYGFSSNQNRALRLVTGRYVLILNPDVLLPERSIAELIEFMEKTPSAGICGPRLVNTEGKGEEPVKHAIHFRRDFMLGALYISHSSEETFQWLKRIRNRKSKQFGSANGPVSTSMAAKSTPREVEILVGACLLIRKKALDEIGYFDERFFLYSEDTDLCVRARQHGWGVYFLPSVHVKHRGAGSTSTNYLKYLQIYMESKLLLYRKHRGRIQESILRILWTFVGWFNLLRWGLLSGKSDDHTEWLAFTRQLLRAMWR